MPAAPAGKPVLAEFGQCRNFSGWGKMGGAQTGWGKEIPAGRLAWSRVCMCVWSLDAAVKSHPWAAADTQTYSTLG